MHIDGPDHIAVSAEPALFTVPLTSAWFVLMPTRRTPATGSSFGAGEAHHAGYVGFVGQISDILAVFPQGHALIVAASTVPGAHTMGIANEEGTNLLMDTEINHLSRGFVAHVTDPALTATTDLVPGTLQPAPAFGPGVAALLLASNLADALEAVPFERANATSRDHQRFARVGGDGGKMNLTQVHRGMDVTGCLFSLWHLDAHMQLKAMVPDQRTCPTVLWQLYRQDEGGASTPHRQHDASVLAAHRLCGPVNRVELFLVVGVLHAHLRVRLAQLPGRVNGGKERVHHHLNRLAVQGKTPFGRFLQGVASRPLRVGHARVFVQRATAVPDLRRFLLSGFQALKLCLRQAMQVVDMDGVHT